MPFQYTRTIRFADTDAAGVVFFANLLAICHEAYEESLASAGIDPASLFREGPLVIPIIASEASFLRPLSVGDRVRVSVAPSPLGDDSFEIRFVIAKSGPRGEKAAVRARTEHVCIDAKTRARRALPAAIAGWTGAR
jgi:1,4-dihydroxy-2-naphthoyl-CoA hydrolase